MPRRDEKKLHIQEFQRKCSNRNMSCKLLQKMFTEKTTECSKHLHHIAIEKDILAELNRCIFQISVKYIKLVIPKILFILVLFNFNFYFKIMWPPTPSHQRLFWNVLPPPLPFKLEGGRCMSWLCKKTILRIRQAS